MRRKTSSNAFYWIVGGLGVVGTGSLVYWLATRKSDQLTTGQQQQKQQQQQQQQQKTVDANLSNLTNQAFAPAAQDPSKFVPHYW
jgi:hypothetical protein